MLSQASADLHARVPIPVHRAKVKLALHPWKEPFERSEAQAATVGMPLLMPQIGDLVVNADGTLGLSRWRSVN